MDKIKLAFVQYAGLASGGTEKQMLILAGNLDKSRFDVDYYWCQPGRDLYTGFKPGRAVPEWKAYIEDRGVRAVEFTVKERDISEPSHKWLGTDFWQVFDYKNYDIIQTCRAGHPEYPFTFIPKPIVEWNVFGSTDFSPNIYISLAISRYILDIWKSNGGNPKKGGLIYPGILDSTYPEKCKRPLQHKEQLVLGFHQSTTDAIFSPIPLQVFAAVQRKVKNRKLKFKMLGGSRLYREQAAELGLENVEFLPYSGKWEDVCNFLLSLDIFTHGRSDGECHGTCIQEAMLHGLPVVSHLAYMNGHVEIVGNGGRVCDGPTEYEDYLLELVNSDELRVGVGTQGLQIAQRDYLARNTVSKFEDLYSRIIADKAGMAACSVPVPEGGYKNPPLFFLAYRRLAYGLSHPENLKHILKRSWAGLSGRAKLRLKRMAGMKV